MGSEYFDVFRLNSGRNKFSSGRWTKFWLYRCTCGRNKFSSNSQTKIAYWLVSHPLSLRISSLSPVLPRHSLSVSGVGDRQQGAAAGGPRCAGGRAAAGRGGRSGRPWPSAAAGRGRRRAGPGAREAVCGGRARPASGASCRGVWAALRHTPGQLQQAGGGSREVEHGTAGAAA